MPTTQDQVELRIPYNITLTFLRSQNRTSHNGGVLVFWKVLTGISNLEALVGFRVSCEPSPSPETGSSGNLQTSPTIKNYETLSS